MSNEKIKILLDQIDGSGSDREFNAIRELKKITDQLPLFLLKKYRSEKKWKPRSACVSHSIRYARNFEESFVLGVEALNDKSKVVQHLACMLLAYSLKKEALPALEQAKASMNSEETLKDINAAIDSIEHQNSNYFVDRTHSGKITLNVH